MTIDLGVPGGNQLITVTGSVALPPCPAHARASVAFAMNCDKSVDVTITYPPAASEPSTAAGYRLVTPLSQVPCRSVAPTVWVRPSRAVSPGPTELTIVGNASARSTGLGLAIVRSIVDAHGGTVLAAPNTNGGLTVTVALP